ncbi:hypothetical protein HPP92_005908 [Vanilla planifolia]|uniref:peptidyl-tRNA hydrolase n=1 Tax=Vanilla planifolia TaxID=51239 RepID=A0A835RNJ6_VANPL|nr:hypothetical protein HPP92_005908 [Vanilla planifolia]
MVRWGMHAAISSAGGVCVSVAGLLKQPMRKMVRTHRRLPSPLSLSASSCAGDASQFKPWLLVGLGNPGKTYQGTRHNVGFEMLDAIAEAEGISVSSIRFKALIGKGHIGDVPVMLAKPQTFMNASGESVGSLVSYFNIPLNQLLLMYDDLDLPFGKLRLLPKGGHGGQNGMRSVINHLKGSRDFPRLRIGIGRPPGRWTLLLFPQTLHQRRKGRDGLHTPKGCGSCDFAA